MFAPSQSCDTTVNEPKTRQESTQEVPMINEMSNNIITMDNNQEDGSDDGDDDDDDDSEGELIIDEDSKKTKQEKIAAAIQQRKIEHRQEVQYQMKHAKEWLLDTIITNRNTVVSLVYIEDAYKEHCAKTGQEPIIASVLARLIRGLFQDAKKCRLGPRGKQKIHYRNLSLRTSEYDYAKKDNNDTVIVEQDEDVRSEQESYTDIPLDEPIDLSTCFLPQDPVKDKIRMASVSTTNDILSAIQKEQESYTDIPLDEPIELSTYFLPQDPVKNSVRMASVSTTDDILSAIQKEQESYTDIQFDEPIDLSTCFLPNYPVKNNVRMANVSTTDDTLPTTQGEQESYKDIPLDEPIDLSTRFLSKDPVKNNVRMASVSTTDDILQTTQGEQESYKDIPFDEPMDLSTCFSPKDPVKNNVQMALSYISLPSIQQECEEGARKLSEVLNWFNYNGQMDIPLMVFAHSSSCKNKCTRMCMMFKRVRRHVMTASHACHILKLYAGVLKLHVSSCRAPSDCGLLLCPTLKSNMARAAMF